MAVKILFLSLFTASGVQQYAANQGIPQRTLNAGEISLIMCRHIQKILMKAELNCEKPRF